ncbi:hypothetical protein VP395_00180 [Mariniflexile soesokkakense]|uniref:Uncharacterized protein n=1 Tax=Mariniflexile soesokkakense TaxID=1343160 RepID=A0ABV0A794_9FLAO
MKKNNYKFIKIFIVIFALTFSSNIHAAQANWFGGGDFWKWISSIIHTHSLGCGHNGFGGISGGGSSDSVPLDGGLGVLLVGAAAFGVKKLRENINDKI